MKETKFRAWDKNNARMLYLGDIIDIAYHCDGGVYNIKDWDDMVSFEKCLLMQYTGLKDKNGKEIYEGDIVRNDEMSSGEIGVVEFIDGCFLDNENWFVEDNGVYSRCSEIIGNIYENPELLENK